MANASQVEQVQDEKKTHQDQILAAHKSMLADKRKVDELTAAAAKEVEGLPAFDKVTRLEGELEAARVELKQQKAGSSHLNEILDNLAQARRDLKDGQGILSSYLVAFMTKYQQRSVNLQFEFHEIDVSAKIGKKLEKQEVLPL